MVQNGCVIRLKEVTMSNNKQTAVEWLEKKLIESGVNLLSEEIEFIQQAKEMDKQQIIDAYQHGSDDENCRLSDGAMAPDYDNADEFYEGEYGGEQ